MRAEEAYLLGQRVVLRHDHPSLADGEVLVREEAEAADRAEGAARMPAKFTARRMRGVFDQCEAAPLHEIGDLVHAAGMTAVVHHQDRTRLRRDRRLEVRRIDREILRPDDVAEDRRRAGVSDRVGGCDEVQRGKKNLVAGPQAEREQSEVKSGRAVRDGKGAFRSAQLRKSALELRNARAHAPPSGADDVGDRFLELSIDEHVGERDNPAAGSNFVGTLLSWSSATYARSRRHLLVATAYSQSRPAATSDGAGSLVSLVSSIHAVTARS